MPVVAAGVFDQSQKLLFAEGVHGLVVVFCAGEGKTRILKPVTSIDRPKQ